MGPALRCRRCFGQPGSRDRRGGPVKHFGRTAGLNELNLSVDQGEVHKFLGPNGAGKTTTLRILLGLLRSDAGSIRLLGATPGAMPWTAPPAGLRAWRRGAVAHPYRRYVATGGRCC